MAGPVHIALAGQQQGEFSPVPCRLQLFQIAVHGQTSLPPGPPAVVIAVAQPDQIGAGPQPGKPAGDIVSPHTHSVGIQTGPQPGAVHPADHAQDLLRRPQHGRLGGQRGIGPQHRHEQQLHSGCRRRGTQPVQQLRRLVQQPVPFQIPAGPLRPQHHPVSPQGGRQQDTAAVIVQSGLPLHPRRGGDGIAVGRRGDHRGPQASLLQHPPEGGGVPHLSMTAPEMGRLGYKVQGRQPKLRQFIQTGLQGHMAVGAVGAQQLPIPGHPYLISPG